MTTKHLVAMLLVGVGVTVALARARGPAGAVSATRTFEVTGVVTAPPAGGRATVAHDEIPGYMPAMTMPFTIGEDAPVLAPGDRVRFTLRVGTDGATAERIVVGGRDAEVARAAHLAATRGTARLKKGDALPAFSLMSHDGRAFTGADLRGRLTAITFIFTRCPIPEFCPLMVKRFQQLQQQMEGDDRLRGARLVSVTLDPAFDTPPVLAAYAKAKGADPKRWLFVTGEPEHVKRLTSAFSIHAERNGVVLDHTLATAIVDGDGRLVEIWRGNGWSVRDLLDVLGREARPRPARLVRAPGD